MGKKTFDINLNKANSITDVIKQLEDYKKELENKTKLFLEVLADKGIIAAINSANRDSHHFDGMVTFEKKWGNGVLYLVGRNDNISGLHTEWYDSEGNYHNNVISPILMLEYGSAGLAIKGHGGSFAVTGNHINDTRWMYYEGIDDNGNPINPKVATAEEPHSPMLHAWEEMIQQIQVTAKEIWK